MRMRFQAGAYSVRMQRLQRTTATVRLSWPLVTRLSARRPQSWRCVTTQANTRDVSERLRAVIMELD